MNSAVFLKTATSHLENAGIGTARLDVLVMFEDILERERGWLLAHPEVKLAKAQIEKLEKWLARRARHEPLAYIRGFTEFYGRKFIINKHVLEPRPESETMIELLKDLVNSRQVTGYGRIRIGDIGTGSGALAVTAQLEIPTAEVIASDIDPNCLEVAKKNAKKHNVNISFCQGDLLAALHPTPYSLPTIFLANLPYVPSRYQVNQAASREPRRAIFGGGDGLELYRRLFYQLSAFPTGSRFVLTESLPPQHPQLAGIAETHGFKLHRHQDFIQVFQKNT